MILGKAGLGWSIWQRSLGKLRKQRKGYQEIGIGITFGGGVEMHVWEKFPAFRVTGHSGCHPNVMDAGVCSQPQTAAVGGVPHCIGFSSEIHSCSSKWFAVVWSKEMAHGLCLESRLVLSWGRQLGLWKALEMLVPADQSHVLQYISLRSTGVICKSHRCQQFKCWWSPSF